MGKKFSILIPAFKAKFLKECIESILTQTFTNFELIIVNDASPEDIDTIVNYFKDNRIRYFKNEKNCGAINVVDNWNKCLYYATGDYVICMGDDDKLCSNCLEEYLKLINKYPNLCIYHAWTEIIDENSNVIKMQEPRPEIEGVYSMMWNRWLNRTQYIGDFLFERNTLLKNGGFYKLPLAWSSDDISSYIAAQNTGIANLQVPVFQYRENSLTISNIGNERIKLNAIEEEGEWYKKFLSKEPPHLNSVEKIFYKMLVKRLPIMIIRKKIYTITQDIALNGLFRAFYYWRIRKQLHLSSKMIIYAIILAFKQDNSIND